MNWKCLMGSIGGVLATIVIGVAICGGIIWLGEVAVMVVLAAILIALIVNEYQDCVLAHKKKGESK